MAKLSLFICLLGAFAIASITSAASPGQDDGQIDVASTTERMVLVYDPNKDANDDQNDVASTTERMVLVYDPNKDTNDDQNDVASTTERMVLVYDPNKDTNKDDNNDDDTGDECEGLDPESVIAGIQIKYLTIVQIYEIANREDEIFQRQLDILVQHRSFMELWNRRSIIRTKRGLGAIVRALFKSFRAGKVTSSGKRTTRHYEKSGNYKDAEHDFDSLKPTDVKTIDKPNVKGKAGMVGDYKVTVRDASKGKGDYEGGPTLSIEAPKKDGKFVRKFRYNERTHKD